MNNTQQQKTRDNIQAQQRQKSNIVQFSTFRVEGELFGVDILHVQEILPYQEITLIPLAPEYIKGLLNLRGQIVAIINLRQRLGFDPLDDNTTGMNLIVTVDKDLMSVFVDQIGDVVGIHEDRLSPPPGTICGVAARYIQAVCQLEEELLIVLDLDNILQYA